MSTNQTAQARKYNTHYDKGKLAAIEGVEHKKNPFEITTPEGIAWLDGWIDGNGFKQALSQGGPS